MKDKNGFATHGSTKTQKQKPVQQAHQHTKITSRKRKRDDTTTSTKDSSLTSSQRQLLFIICVTRFLNQIASFWGSICVPIEAHKRDVSSLTVGILTATETAISWVTSIYISASFTKFGGQEKAAERLLMFGIVSHSVSIVFVATTELSRSMFAFVILFATSYACSGVGLACSMTSINALIIAHYDNDQITQAKSIETICYTLGTVLAFVVAGLLYMWGGLATVVISVGSIELMWGILCCFWLPAVLPKLQRTLTLERSLRNLRASEEFEMEVPIPTKEPKESWAFLKDLMSVSEIRFILVNHFMRYMTLAFNQPILSNRLQSFGLAPPMIGVVVALAYIAIAVVAVPYKMLGSSPRRIKVILVGSLVVFFPIPALMGPIQLVQRLFNVQPNPWLLAVTLTIAGILLAPGLVLDQLAVTEAGEKAGLFPRERSVATSGAIGGILASFEFLGLFLGPPIGGACKDFFHSFEDGIFYGGFITIFFGFLWLFCSLFNYARQKFMFKKNLEYLSNLPDTAV